MPAAEVTAGAAAGAAAVPKVALLMGVFNGARFLAEQLDSLAAQTHENWRLWAADDGSSDASPEILSRYQAAWGGHKLKIIAGPRRGFQYNFLELTARLDLDADYYAWCDQDDIWLPGKLSRALSRLAPYGQEVPALYGGRTILMTAQGRDYGQSPLLNRRPLGFANALLQCVMGSNTMVFNRAARTLIVTGADLEIYSHDWWAYQVISGAGGLVIYDPEPQIRYRQHGGNLFGTNRGLAARGRRLRQLLDGGFRRFWDSQLEALAKIAPRLTPDSQRRLAALAELRSEPNPWQRLRRFLAGGFYRQTPTEQFVFTLAIAAGQV